MCKATSFGIQVQSFMLSVSTKSHANEEDVKPQEIGLGFGAKGLGFGV